MAITCPYCGRSLGVKGAKPGQYTPKCSGCGRPFVLTVSADPANPLSVAPLPGAAEPAVALPVAVLVAQAAPAHPVPEAIPDRLGGYQVLKELGRGGMGSVYLARQLSLDRNVALKVMNPRWAQNSRFMARFTREAYAAAQLVHPNIVQIYDLGSDRGFHFFSMELVEGESLADLVKRQGRLDVHEAVGYVLQAARGLKHGHERGMIHRDVKPANLLLNGQGIVKVADLGLVKTPEAVEPIEERPGEVPAIPEAAAQLTVAHRTMGTPAYMAPEQARNATRVDARADVYSLGCTLYVLLTGQPPFQGSTALEVMTRHAFEPVVPPDALVQHVPKVLSEIILKMVAKKPEERYADMGEVIQALEDFLGVQGAGRFTPAEEQAALLARCVQRFHDAPAARLRGQVMLAFFAGCGLLLVLCVLSRWWLAALSVASLATLTPLAYVLVHGFAQHTHLVRQLRELVLESSRTDRLLGVGGGVLFLGLLYLLGLLGLWMVLCVLAVGLAVTFHAFVDHPVAVQRQAPVEQVEQMLRGLRLQGIGEEALREFVCRYGGEHWEALHEALFGYEAKMRARTRWAESEPGRPRARCAAWRDPVIAWIESLQLARRAAHDRKLLQTVEQQSLEARGMAAPEAQARAEEAAAVVVHTAEAIRQESAAPSAAPQHPVAIPVEARPLPSVAELLELPDQPETLPPRPRPRRLLYPILERVGSFLFGPRARLLVGAALVAGCVGWMYQNGLIPGEEIKKLADEAVEQQEVPDVSDLNLDWDRETRPLDLPLVPAAVLGLFDSFSPGAAGLILVLSALVLGPRIALFAWAAACVAFAGPWLGVPAVGPVSVQQVSMAAGVALAVLGFLVDRYV